MVLQIFPEPSLSTLNSDAYTVPFATKQYKLIKNFDAAVYTITTSPTTSQATIQFDTGSQIYTTTTISGSVSYNLPVTATNALVTTSTGTDVVVTIAKVASAISGSEISGTLDTITSTGTYNQMGKLYVITVGGGGGGAGAGSNTFDPGGGGGGAGQLQSALLYVNTSTSITVGSQGNAGNSGGATSFGNLLTSNGGESGSGATGGSFGGGSGGQSDRSGISTSSNVNSVKSGTNGGGGGGGNIYTPTGASGGGSGIGTGGTGGNSGGSSGGNANGYGAGGGGAGSGPGNPKSGGSGSPGVVYVLRGF